MSSFILQENILHTIKLLFCTLIGCMLFGILDFLTSYFYCDSIKFNSRLLLCAGVLKGWKVNAQESNMFSATSHSRNCRANFYALGHCPLFSNKSVPFPGILYF